jgi:uncharacterized surface protein with fasciclin (FAS1) repeats
MRRRTAIRARPALTPSIQPGLMETVGMTNVLKALGIGILTCGAAACSSSSPVAPTATSSLISAEGAAEPTASVAAASTVATSKPGYAGAARPGDLSIVEIVLQDDGEFDVLQTPVVRAGLVDALNGSTQHTVFAPTDAAFVSTLGVADEAAALAAVNALPIDTLRDILLYHATEGRRQSRSVLAASSYRMLNGATLSRDQLLAAGIATPHVSASNGIVHVINAVLLPS